MAIQISDWHDARSLTQWVTNQCQMGASHSVTECHHQVGCSPVMPGALAVASNSLTLTIMVQDLANLI